MIKLRVSNVFTDIDGPVPQETYQRLRKKMSFRPKGYEFSTLFNRWVRDKNGKPVRRMWDGWRRQIWKTRGRNTLYFPTGLLTIVRDVFIEDNLEHELLECRHKPEVTMHLSHDDSLKIRDYQQKIIDTACQQQRGIIQVATGGGKTILSSGIIKQLGVKPFLFFVTSIDLLIQAKESFEAVLRENEEPVVVGQIGGGVIDIQDINVMTIQTAVRALGEKYVKFDVEDTDDKTPIESRREDILNLLHHAKGAICDECISGNTIVTTRTGPVRMSELYEYTGKDILSFKDNSAVWKKLTHFYPKGKKKTLKIILQNGETIQATKDHPIMTNQGWKEAKRISPGDLILCSASVVADSRFLLKEGALADTHHIYSDTKSNRDQKENGSKYSTKPSKTPQCANADVEKKHNYIQELLNHSLIAEELKNTIDSYMDTTNVHSTGTLNCQNQNKIAFSEPSLEIQDFHFQQKEAKTRDSIATMDYASRNGQNINQHILAASRLNTGNTTMGGMATEVLHLEHAVIQNYIAFITLCSKMVKRRLRFRGLIPLVTLVLRGGFAMMEVVVQIISDCIQRDFHTKKFRLFPNGFQADTDQLAFITLDNITPYISENRHDNALFHKSKSTFQNACNTRYVEVKSVSPYCEEQVFDITVEDTHCFFANNILVHNCQHWRAETCQLVARSLKESYYTYGCSATPYRDEGDDLMIYACFGKKIAEVDASQLIKEGWLIKPSIKIVHVRGPQSSFRQWQQIYKDQVSENKDYNAMVSSIANSYIQNNRLVLVLVQQIAHGKRLAASIPGSIFLSGNSSKKKRQEGINNLRKREISCIISTVIFDEGIDVRPLDTVLLAGQGKSRVRAMQRIGRILRPFEGKEVATAIDFRIHQKYLLDHSIEREKMYKTEPEYEIEEIDP